MNIVAYVPGHFFNEQASLIVDICIVSFSSFRQRDKCYPEKLNITVGDNLIIVKN